MSHRLGVDIGGTFTDFALVDDDSGTLLLHKQLTSPEDPSRSVLSGVQALLERASLPLSALRSIAHGTTLVTNAVIERKGARTGMLVTRGFRDVLDIAMERRYDLFDLRLTFAEPVVPRALREEIDERVSFDGAVDTPLDDHQVRTAITRLVEEQRVEAVAVCFLHAYANPEHEARAAEIAAQAYPELRVTTSAQMLPFMREYERWSTTTVNAYVRPLTDRYLNRLETGLRDLDFTGQLLVMTSSGGMATTDMARQFPARLIESGPAAGALMAAFLGRRMHEPDLLSFDMGGTTAKGALIRGGRALRRYEFEVARVHEFKQGSGLPLRIPVIDMIEIGAGGGSIASLDERNLLKVGPASAGAEPGPACYAQGGELPTLTDANVTLGYLQPQAFLGGRMTLDADAARQAIATGIAQRSDLEITRAAWGIHEVINEDVARAFRVHASELGFDYRRCAMVAFGGSGPAHALRIARKLRIPKVIFPVGAGVMSAIGLLTVPISFATLRSARVRLTELDTQGLHAGFASIEDQAARMLEQAGVEPESIVIERRLDMRFYGQGHEVEVSLPADVRVEQLAELFVRTYAQTFAATPLDAEIEIVNWKIEASGPEPGFVSHYQASAPRRDTSPAADPGPAVPTMTTRIFDPLAQTFVDCPVHEREALLAGAWVEGPALIQEREATTVLGVGERLQVDTHGNLVAILSANSDSERARS